MAWANRGGGGAITRLVLGFGGHLLDQLGSEILEGILQLDIPGDGVAVIDDVRGAELLLQHHIAAAGSDGDLHRIGQSIDATLQSAAGFVGKGKKFGHGLDSAAGHCPIALEPLWSGP